MSLIWSIKLDLGLAELKKELIFNDKSLESEDCKKSYKELYIYGSKDGIHYELIEKFDPISWESKHEYNEFTVPLSVAIDLRWWMANACNGVSGTGIIYYVRTSGNDLNDGLTPDTAWRTLWHVNENMVAGDIVYIGAGNYSNIGSTAVERWVIPTNNGTSSNHIQFIGDHDGSHTGDAGLPKVGEICPSSYCTVIGLEAMMSVHGVNYYTNIIIDRCKFPWISCDRLGEITVKNCLIIRGSETVQKAIYASNLCPGNLYFYHNTIIHDINNTDAVVVVSINYNFYFKNNIVLRKQGDGYILYFDNYETKTHCDYNCYYSLTSLTNFGRWKKYDCGSGQHIEPTFVDWQAHAICDACISHCDQHSQWSNPIFIGISDYHLEPYSPCIDAGTDLGIYIDFDWNPRPQAGGYDQGAYECETTR